MIQGITIEANSVVVKGSDFDALCALARENEQLRGTLSLAEEGLANYAQENAQLRALTRWQPIETAPTDGTPILAWLKRCNRNFDYGDWLVVRADKTMNAVYADRTGELFWSIPGVGGLKASHWMPLPQEPQSAPIDV